MSRHKDDQPAHQPFVDNNPFKSLYDDLPPSLPGRNTPRDTSWYDLAAGYNDGLPESTLGRVSPLPGDSPHSLDHDLLPWEPGYHARKVDETMTRRTPTKLRDRLPRIGRKAIAAGTAVAVLSGVGAGALLRSGGESKKATVVPTELTVDDESTTTTTETTVDEEPATTAVTQTTVVPETTTPATVLLPETTTTAPEVVVENPIESLLAGASPVSVALTQPELAFYPTQLDPTVTPDNTTHYYCDNTTQMQIPNAPNQEFIARGAYTEYALTKDSLQDLYGQMDQAGSRAGAEAAVTSFLQAQLGVSMTFIGAPEPSSSVFSSDDGVESLNLTDTDYLAALKQELAAFTYLPKEIFDLATTKNILITDHDLVSHSISGDSKGLLGFYSPSDNTVTAEVTGGKKTIIHELGHGVHDAMCAEDRTLEIVYKEAAGTLLYDERYQELNTKLQAYSSGDESAISYDEFVELQDILTAHGIPSFYGLSQNEEYFAELFYEIVTQGYSTDQNPVEGFETVREKSIELILKRMQASMPDVDVAAWAQYAAEYTRNGFSPDVIAPADAIAMQASVLDSGVVHDPRTDFPADWNFGTEAMAAYPAVNITVGDKVQSIHVYYDAASKTVFTALDKDIDKPEMASVKEAVATYISSLGLRQLSTTTSTNGDTTIDIAAYTS